MKLRKLHKRTYDFWFFLIYLNYFALENGEVKKEGERAHESYLFTAPKAYKRERRRLKVEWISFLRATITCTFIDTIAAHHQSFLGAQLHIVRAIDEISIFFTLDTSL